MDQSSGGKRSAEDTFDRPSKMAKSAASSSGEAASSSAPPITRMFVAAPAPASAHHQTTGAASPDQAPESMEVDDPFPVEGERKESIAK